MPELPEVETVKTGMENAILNHQISAVIVRRAGLRTPFPADLQPKIEGKVITGLRRRSKYILVDMDGPDIMLIHLGMSGKITLSKNVCLQRDPGKHDHFEFITRQGSRLIYTDPRRFGIITLFPKTSEATHPLLKDIGPEPLSNHFNGDFLFSKLSARKSPIKNVLLDQKTVAGLGNIYVCEALWRARIDPKRPANKIHQKEAYVLYRHIVDVLKDAIKSGGSTLRDYVGVNGELGYFQHKFDVYGREKEPCRTMNCDDTVTRIVQSGRSTFYCSTCQG